jgi:hypothetical protein
MTSLNFIIVQRKGKVGFGITAVSMPTLMLYIRKLMADIMDMWLLGNSLEDLTIP